MIWVKYFYARKYEYPWYLSQGTAKTFAEKLMKSIGARKRQQTFHVSIKNMSEYNFEDNLDKEVRIVAYCIFWYIHAWVGLLKGAIYI